MNQVNLAAWGQDIPLFVRLLAAEVAASNKTKVDQPLTGFRRDHQSVISRMKALHANPVGLQVAGGGVENAQTVGQRRSQDFQRITASGGEHERSPGCSSRG